MTGFWQYMAVIAVPWAAVIAGLAWLHHIGRCRRDTCDAEQQRRDAAPGAEADNGEVSEP